MTGKISTFTAIITLMQLCLGLGLLVLPFATMRGGLIFSPIGTVLVAAWNGLSCLMVIKCRVASLYQKSLGPKVKVVDVLFLSTYSEVAYSGLGYFGVYLGDFCVVVTLLGLCCLYQINFATLLAGISFLIDYHISISVFIVFSSSLVYPISLAKDLRFLASISLIGLICILVNCAAVLIYGVILYDNETRLEAMNADTVYDHDIPMFPSSYGNTAAYFGVASFCFGICSFIKETMQNQDKLAGAVFYSLCLVCLVYIVVGDGGAFLYNDFTSGHISSNILLNLPVDSIAATVARLAYPIALLPPATMIEKMISFYYNKLYNATVEAKPIKPTTKTFIQHTADILNPVNNAADSATSLLFQIDHTAQSYQSIDVTNNTQHSPQLIVEMTSPLKSKVNKTHSTSADDSLTSGSLKDEEEATAINADDDMLPWKWKVLIRLILVVISTVSAGYVPCFGAVVSLLGYFTMSILSFVLPPLLHFRLVTLPALQTSPLFSTGSKDRIHQPYKSINSTSNNTDSTTSTSSFVEAHRVFSISSGGNNDNNHNKVNQQDILSDDDIEDRFRDDNEQIIIDESLPHQLIIAHKQPEPRLPPKIQTVVDITLIVVGLLLFIVGTAITFNQIRHSNSQC